MNGSRFAPHVRAHLLLPLLALAALAALVLPTAAGASVQLQIVNQTGRSDVYVSLHGGAYDVEGAAEDEGLLLSSNPAAPLNLTVNKLISGRVYVSFGQAVKEGVTFESLTRFDWAELTVTPATGDVGNLTAVDQFAIAMRMEALDESGHSVGTIGEANADTIFNAMQGIPGGAGATIRNGGEILRVLSPVHSTAYPQLSEYVKSMAGQTLTLHSSFNKKGEVASSEYSGGVQPDGSIVLNGTYWTETSLAEPPPSTITIPAAQLLSEIYAPTTSANNLEAAIKRDLLAAFSIGLWGGRYDNDALSFCSTHVLTAGHQVCQGGFNVPAFGEARTSFPTYATCNQYAAVINQYSDSYGSAYSDASKKVTVSLDQEHTNPAEDTKTLRLTILPDSGSAMPVSSGNPNCGAGAPAPAPAPASSGGASKDSGTAPPHVHFANKAKVRKGKARVARLRCATACGQVKAVAKRGKKVLARVKRGKVKAAKPWVVVHLTKRGKRMLHRRHRLQVRVNLLVHPAGGKWASYHHKVKLIAQS